MPPESHRQQWQRGEVPMWNTRLAQAVYLLALLCLMGALAYGVAAQ
jgi:hypothetical protein